MSKPGAFYGRVSTNNLQEPIASRRWQHRLIEPLLAAHDYVIVEEFFDEESRQLPWKLRLVAQQVLTAVASPTREWDALFIAEPQRAFMGSQWSDVLPLFRHYGVTFYAPEFPSGFDHTSTAHQMQIAIYGSLSAGEIERTRTRVVTTMEGQTQHEGRYMGGRPPYGYQIVDGGPHPNPAKSRSGQRLRALDLDPESAPVARRIFDEFLGGHGLGKIAAGLVADGIPSPSAHDPERNPHRVGASGAWAKSALRVILRNPRYTGYQVWRRTAGEQTLRDVDDLSLGDEKRMIHKAPDDWIWSNQPVHPAIITLEEHRMALARYKTEPGSNHGRRATNRPYRARGLVRCALCNRKMNSHWLRNKPGYRCVYGADYVLPKDSEHPKSVYLAEGSFIGPLSEWLTGLFDEEHLDSTCELLASVALVAPDDHAMARAAAEEAVAKADEKIARCEAALDAGGDLGTITAWLNTAVAEREQAHRVLAERPAQPSLTAADYRTMIKALPDAAEVFRTGHAKDVQQLLEALGVELRYHPIKKTITASAGLPCCATDRVGGGT